MSVKRAIAAAAALMVIGGLAGCSSAGSQAAQEAYDQCVREDTDVQLLHLSKNTVSIEGKGDEARAYPGSSDQLTDGDEWDGWHYREEAGAGSEMTLSFISTR